MRITQISRNRLAAWLAKNKKRFTLLIRAIREISLQLAYADRWFVVKNKRFLQRNRLAAWLAKNENIRITQISRIRKEKSYILNSCN